MIIKFLLNNQQVPKIVNLVTVRTKIHPTPSRIDFIQGKSAIGKPAAYEPVRVELEKGKSYSYCACGGSKKQPYCDGTHKKMNAELKEGEEKFGPLRFVCEESKTALMCMCKNSSNRPYCDGTHVQMKSKKI